MTIAGGLMLLMGLLGLISAITTFASLGQVADRFRELAARTDAASSDVDNLVTGLRAIMLGSALITLLFSLIVIGLALGVLRGSNMARILTWVFCGLGLLCGCCGIIGAFGQTNANSFGNQNMDSATADELGRAMQDAYPSWWLVVNGGVSGLQALGYIAIAILLALPAANAFFRKPSAPQWQPPAR